MSALSLKSDRSLEDVIFSEKKSRWKGACKFEDETSSESGDIEPLKKHESGVSKRTTRGREYGLHKFYVDRVRAEGGLGMYGVKDSFDISRDEYVWKVEARIHRLEADNKKSWTLYEEVALQSAISARYGRKDSK